jgi:threonine dehydratase
LEHLQHTGSFKFRGASNRIALLTAAEAEAGVVAACNGNHGLGGAAPFR